MPYKIIKVGNKFRVININTGRVHSNTSLKKARAQLRLLNFLHKNSTK